MINPEVRTLVLAPGELRARKRDDGRPAIFGLAIPYDRWTTLYEGEGYVWREVFRPGAVARVIRETHDVRALFNHDPNYLLGRVASGTLVLAEDAAGLHDEILYPDTQLVRDLVVTPIERGDMVGQSNSFLVRNKTPESVSNTGLATVIQRDGERITLRMDGKRLIEEREVLDADIFDVGPVTFPQYEQTDIATRARGERREREILLRRQSRLHLAEARLRLHDAAIISSR